MALTGAVQGIVIFGVVVWYSAVVWRTIDHHFRDEFKKHLVKEYKLNKHLKINDDDVAASSETTTATPLPDIKPTQVYAPQENADEESTSCSIKTVIQKSEDLCDADPDSFCRIDDSSEKQSGG